MLIIQDSTQAEGNMLLPPAAPMFSTSFSGFGNGSSPLSFSSTSFAASAPAFAPFKASDSFAFDKEGSFSLFFYLFGVCLSVSNTYIQIDR